jgi:hypothetical protein
MATRVTITKALEAKLRQKWDPLNPEDAFDAIAEIVKRLDDEQGKREAGAQVTEAQTGLGYKALVSLFRSSLGDDLTTPPKPSTSFIIKVVNKAKEQGIDSTNVEQILRGARRLGRAPYRLADLIWNADQYYSAGVRGEHTDASGEVAEAEEAGHRIYTGRNFD